MSETQPQSTEAGVQINEKLEQLKQVVHIRLEKHQKHGHLLAFSYEPSPGDRQAFMWPAYGGDNKILVSFDLAGAESAADVVITLLELITGYHFKKVRDDDMYIVYEREDNIMPKSIPA